MAASAPLGVPVASAPTVTATRLLHRHGLGVELRPATGRLLGPRAVQTGHAGTAPALTNPEPQRRLDEFQELAADLDPQQVNR